MKRNILKRIGSIFSFLMVCVLLSLTITQNVYANCWSLSSQCGGNVQPKDWHLDAKCDWEPITNTRYSPPFTMWTNGNIHCHTTP